MVFLLVNHISIPNSLYRFGIT